MSNTIPPYSQPGLAETGASPPASAGVQPAAQAHTAAIPAAQQAESVTLSPAAQSGAKLLAAAQGSSGIDQQAVAAIRAQLASGTYNVAPENLAQAIATVLKETKS